MPSRLIQLNGMNVNAGGLIEFRATMRPPSQAVPPARVALVSNLEIAKAFGLKFVYQ